VVAESILSGLAELVTALGVILIGVLGWSTHRTQKNQVIPQLEATDLKVTAIDYAVNGQPPGAETMVDNVKQIRYEQSRVATELTDYKDDQR